MMERRSESSTRHTFRTSPRRVASSLHYKDPLQTPPRSGTVPDSTVHSSTPLSQCTGTHHTHKQDSTHDSHKPYLMEDLKSQVVLPWQTLLGIVVPEYSTIPWSLRPARSQEIRKEIDLYKSISVEEKRYAPIVAILNAIVDGDFEMDFCRNDDTFLWGSPAKRKPDIVGVHSKALAHVDRFSVDNLSKKGPTTDPFHWSEPMIFVEVEASKALKQPSSIAPPPPKESKESNTKSAAQKKGASVSQPPRRSTRNPTPATSANLEAVTKDSSSFSADSSSQRKSGDTDLIGFSQEKQKQCASYAMELLSYGGLRRHVLGIFIRDEVCYFLYYDRSAIVISQPFYWLHEIETFKKIIYCLARLDPGGLGFEDILADSTSKAASGPPYLPTLPKPREKYERYEFRDTFINKNLKIKDITYSLTDVIYQQHCIIGRGTKVVRANSAENGEYHDKKIVIKISYMPRQRLSEAAIIDMAQGAAASNENSVKFSKHLPNLIAEHVIKGHIENSGHAQK